VEAELIYALGVCLNAARIERGNVLAHIPQSGFRDKHLAGLRDVIEQITHALNYYRNWSNHG